MCVTGTSLTASSTGINGHRKSKSGEQPLLVVHGSMESKVNAFADMCLTLKDWRNEPRIPYRALCPFLIHVADMMERDVLENWERDATEYTRSAFMSNMLSRLALYNQRWNPAGFFPKVIVYLQDEEGVPESQSDGQPSSGYDMEPLHEVDI
jgi:hypothetical protein